ncbi:hypothetical protein ZEAMMB73_Zm00001d015437 [Zea mays]|nr:hypothetical protein ZEAMMB73_Zm00001d015437 [Zea mays]
MERYMRNHKTRPAHFGTFTEELAVVDWRADRVMSVVHRRLGMDAPAGGEECADESGLIVQVARQSVCLVVRVVREAAGGSGGRAPCAERDHGTWEMGMMRV